ncbi:hypothetical protein OGAPHI_004529 [Ogataea philodendri]|uniref:Uncharacterized protein n=1 Tax=Ogataea philodendri TaxID=1378263 RepID=A0A9P8P799_9ASCO|nr:uncharacterized protein OGAPHI_004529 [Ogataea philodendri]KAH3666340.1 hypothetical protein OGAPHI_004529 [Ogataea philodendri]
MSVGRPILGAAGVALATSSKAFMASGVLSINMSVLTGPGLTAFTVQWYFRPSSKDHTLMSPSTAAFVAEALQVDSNPIIEDRLGESFEISIIANTSIMNEDINLAGSNFLTTFAGTPKTNELLSTSFVTVAPAPTTTLSPNVTPGRMVTFAPSQQLSPILIGKAYSSPAKREFTSSG